MLRRRALPVGRLARAAAVTGIAAAEMACPGRPGVLPAQGWPQYGEQGREGRFPYPDDIQAMDLRPRECGRSGCWAAQRGPIGLHYCDGAGRIGSGRGPRRLGQPWGEQRFGAGPLMVFPVLPRLEVARVLRAVHLPGGTWRGVGSG